MLQLLDDGRLTDSKGTTVSFRNCVIIFTSNVGSDAILDLAGRVDEEREGGVDGAAFGAAAEMKSRVMGAMRDKFRPEFLNRVDEFVVFNSLGRAELRSIVGLEIERVGARLEDRKIELSAGAAALDLLAAVGHDPVYGARPLKRAVQREVETPVAKALLKGEFAAGDTIELVVEDERLALRKIIDAAAVDADSATPVSPTESPIPVATAAATDSPTESPTPATPTESPTPVATTAATDSPTESATPVTPTESATPVATAAIDADSSTDRVTPISPTEIATPVATDSPTPVATTAVDAERDRLERDVATLEARLRAGDLDAATLRALAEAKESLAAALPAVAASPDAASPTDSPTAAVL